MTEGRPSEQAAPATPDPTGPEPGSASPDVTPAPDDARADQAPAEEARVEADDAAAVDGDAQDEAHDGAGDAPDAGDAARDADAPGADPVDGADELSTDEDPADEGPAVEGPADEGPAVEGPADEGPAVEGPADEDPAVEGPADEDPAVEGPAEEVPADVADGARVGDAPANDLAAEGAEEPALFGPERTAAASEPADEPPAESDEPSEPAPGATEPTEPIEPGTEPETEPGAEPGPGAEPDGTDRAARADDASTSPQEPADSDADPDATEWAPRAWPAGVAADVDEHPVAPRHAEDADRADEAAAPVTRTSVLGAAPRPAHDAPGPATAPTQRLDLPGDDAPTSPAAPHEEPAAPDEPANVAPPRIGSPIDVFPEEERPRRWPKALGVTAAVLVVLAGVYVGALWLLSDRVPPGTTVAGVDVGGLAVEDAAERLETELATAVVEPVPVAAGETRTTFDPVAAGLTLDVDATLAQVTGFGLEPVRLWYQAFGSGPLDPVVDVDEGAFTAALDATADALATEPVDGGIVFVDGAPSATDAVDGSEVDREAAAELLTSSWLTAPRPVELPTRTVPPAITQEEVERALREEARPLASAPVVVAVADERVEFPAEVVAAAASFVAEGGTLALQLDGQALVDAVLARTEGLLDEPTDAQFVFQDGVPVIQPGVPGTTIDPEALAAAVAAAATGGDRTARVELVERTPEVTTEDLEALGVVEVVSEFSTPLTNDSVRTKNLVAGTAAINGTLVRPGEVFSLTEALGPIDAAHGFVSSGAIVNGRHTNVWGGGLSQVSTTMYNAAFLAGMEDVEHTPHSEWFRRYPEGREATLFTGSIDLKWRNTTPYGALVQAWVADGRTWVRIWGTKYWEVQHSTSSRSAVRQPTTIYDTSSGCEPQAAGNPGFRVTVTRTLLLEGEVKDQQSWTHTYRPQNRIVCGPEPGSTDAPDAEG